MEVFPDYGLAPLVNSVPTKKIDTRAYTTEPTAQLKQALQEKYHFTQRPNLDNPNTINYVYEGKIIDSLGYEAVRQIVTRTHSDTPECTAGSQNTTTAKCYIVYAVTPTGKTIYRDKNENEYQTMYAPLGNSTVWLNGFMLAPAMSKEQTIEIVDGLELVPTQAQR